MTGLKEPGIADFYSFSSLSFSSVCFSGMSIARSAKTPPTIAAKILPLTSGFKMVYFFILWNDLKTTKVQHRLPAVFIYEKNVER